jgi:hypothetical protein
MSHATLPSTYLLRSPIDGIVLEFWLISWKNHKKSHTIRALSCKSSVGYPLYETVVLTLELQKSVSCDVSCHFTTISLSVQNASTLNVEAKYLIYMAMDIFKVRGNLEYLILRRNIRDQIRKKPPLSVWTRTKFSNWRWANSKAQVFASAAVSSLWIGTSP